MATEVGYLYCKWRLLGSRTHKVFCRESYRWHSEDSLTREDFGTQRYLVSIGWPQSTCATAPEGERNIFIQSFGYIKNALVARFLFKNYKEQIYETRARS